MSDVLFIYKLHSTNTSVLVINSFWMCNGRGIEVFDEYPTLRGFI